MSRPVVGLLYAELQAFADQLSDRYDIVELWTPQGTARTADVQAMVTIGGIPLPADRLGTLPSLGLIACCTAGYDGLDLPTLASRGIALTHAVFVNEDVADHAIGLMIAHRKRFAEGDRRVREGGWATEGRVFSPSLRDAKLGIVGLGGIGTAAAHRADAFRMVVRWWGPHAKPAASWPRAASLLDLAAWSDILLVSASAHGDAAIGMIAGAVIDALGPHGLLVNIARGSLLDEEATISALRDGRLGGAALDVFEQEPTPADRWKDVPNCLLTPHSAGATGLAFAQMVGGVAGNLDAFFAGRPLTGQVAMSA
jgi:hydroxypyruvate reductase